MLMNKEMNKLKRFYNAKDVAEMLEVSETTAYRIIKQLNDQLKNDGYIIIPGRISINYFESKVAI